MVPRKLELSCSVSKFRNLLSVKSYILIKIFNRDMTLSEYGGFYSMLYVVPDTSCVAVARSATATRGMGQIVYICIHIYIYIYI